jgi:uncharacterized protein (TIRG00374 family)
MRLINHFVKKIAVYIIAAGCIVWVLKGVRLNEMLSHMRGMNPWWIAGAVALDVITTVLHGIRWRFLLRSITSTRLLRTVQAIYTGLFANEILPVKAGEFVRGYLISRWANVSFASILPSMIAERVLDGSLLVLGLGLSASLLAIPREIKTAAVVFGAALLIVVLLLIVLAYRGKRSSGSVSGASLEKRGFTQHIAAFGGQFIAGLRLIKSSTRLSVLAGISVLYFSTQVLAYWLIMKAYGIHFSIGVPTVVLIIVRLGTAVPNAPANIGPYQFFCVLALMMFGVDKTTATGFAVALWLIFSIPILILGLAAFLGSGLSLSDLKQRERSG